MDSLIWGYPFFSSGLFNIFTSSAKQTSPHYKGGLQAVDILVTIEFPLQALAFRGSSALSAACGVSLGRTIPAGVSNTRFNHLCFKIRNLSIKEGMIL
ncbi:hypothetical protein CN380_05465 [Bacillus sp. AFS017274]|nr:hypothetical protein CN380_05465 [Bacillus sp. AFS017274]